MKHFKVQKNERMFELGERVRCIDASWQHKNAEGTVVIVMSPPGGLAQYDVRFEFGVRTLYGDQIESLSY